MENDNIFSEEYLKSEPKTGGDMKSGIEEYGLNKPQRIIIKGKISHEKDN